MKGRNEWCFLKLERGNKGVVRRERRGEGRMKVVGLTGGIATGKSSVSRQLARRGVSVIDADAVYAQLSKRVRTEK